MQAIHARGLEQLHAPRTGRRGALRHLDADSRTACNAVVSHHSLRLRPCALCSLPPLQLPHGSFGADYSSGGRAQVTQMLDDAHRLGLNVVRLWAFTVTCVAHAACGRPDGSDGCAALAAPRFRCSFRRPCTTAASFAGWTSSSMQRRSETLKSCSCSATGGACPPAACACGTVAHALSHRLCHTGRRLAA
jgi:hypothetical protein